MASTEINNYISKRYDRWLDYAIYHCNRNGMADEAVDVLNEVLLSLLQKSDTMLRQLLSAKKKDYTDLDFFVLKMIKLNITSSTSPYQSKYKSLPSDENTDFDMLDEIEDRMTDQTDKSGELLDQIHCVRNIFDSLDLSKLARRVFEFHFFQD